MKSLLQVKSWLYFSQVTSSPFWFQVVDFKSLQRQVGSDWLTRSLLLG